jgi:D-sedoheptulose 7-phosphate isomerase
MESLSTLIKASSNLLDNDIKQAIKTITDSIKEGGKVLVCGNGGSAADAQHFVTELVVRFREERKGIPAIALTTDTSVLTATSNDYSFDKVFSRQIDTLANPSDVLIIISTSGTSPNVLEALKSGISQMMNVIFLTSLKADAVRTMYKDFTHIQFITVPSTDTPRIQEIHELILHIIAEFVEKFWKLFLGGSKTK